MFGKKFRITDISAPFPRNVASKDSNSAPVIPPSGPLTPVPATAATIGPAAMAAPDQPGSPSANFVPNSWPNSGFRNSRQRGTGGG